ncbi:MAG: DMT family transporter [Fusobacteriaceae bacterium]|jgi:drug/metabolite transporter (DMT)-like permease|nr:DMT family transporter [Fusobacteriaceae bacterium]
MGTGNEYQQNNKKMMNQKYKGIIFIVLSAFFFALTNTFVRLSGDLPSVQKSFFRNFVAALIAITILLKDKDDISIKKEHLKYFLLRAILGTIGVLCNFYAIDHLVMADATMLNKMSPFFAIIFSWILLKEKLKPLQTIAIIGAFIGSLFIIKPTFQNAEIIPSLIGFMGGLTSGAGFCFIRILGNRGVKGVLIVFFFSSFSCITTLPYIVTHYAPMTLKQIFILMMAGTAAAGGQFSMTKAYFYAPAKEISVYDYSQIIFAAIIGFVIFNQIPDKYSWLGYAIILSMAIMMFIYTDKDTSQQ